MDSSRSCDVVCLVCLDVCNSFKRTGLTTSAQPDSDLTPSPPKSYLSHSLVSNPINPPPHPELSLTSPLTGDSAHPHQPLHHRSLLATPALTSSPRMIPLRSPPACPFNRPHAQTLAPPSGRHRPHHPKITRLLGRPYTDIESVEPTQSDVICRLCQPPPLSLGLHQYKGS
jgi:hypothetical protein